MDTRADATDDLMLLMVVLASVSLMILLTSTP